MQLEQEDTGGEYLRPEERIYDIATDKESVDWRNLLYQLIHNEGLDPWNVDLSVLTKKYLEALKEIKEVDFDLSGKFLTIAVFLLKMKAERLIDTDIRGIEQSIAAVENADSFDQELDMLEDFDGQLDEIPKKKEYNLKIRNPIARKRKVNIFDLIRSLEKTIEQSNKRRSNFLQRKEAGKYEGPMYEKKPKDLKSLIAELYEMILAEIESKKGHVAFSHFTNETDSKMEILEKFIPLLHLHNQEKVTVKQKNHFDEIEIHPVTTKINKGEDSE